MEQSLDNLTANPLLKKNSSPQDVPLPFSQNHAIAPCFSQLDPASFPTPCTFNINFIIKLSPPSQFVNSLSPPGFPAKVLYEIITNTMRAT